MLYLISGIFIGFVAGVVVMCLLTMAAEHNKN